MQTSLLPEYILDVADAQDAGDTRATSEQTQKPHIVIPLWAVLASSSVGLLCFMGSGKDGDEPGVVRK